MPRNKKSTKVVLGHRDISLLKDIFFSKIVDTRTIIRRHFPDNCYNIAIRRINILFKAGYLKKVGLSNYGKRQLGYSVTEKSLTVLKQNLGTKINRKELASDNVLHDLSLNHIVDRLKLTKGLIALKTENELQSLSLVDNDNSLVPFKRLNTDVCIKIESNNQTYRFALEYERVTKVKDRWEEYLLSYHLEEEIDAVLYVCENHTILKTLSKVEMKLCKTYSAKVYFITLSNFISGEKKATFENVFGHKFTLYFH